MCVFPAQWPYDATPFKQKWRLFWPWEQVGIRSVSVLLLQIYEIFLKGPLHSIYMRNRRSMMVLSFPSLPNLPCTSKKKPTSQYPTDPVEPWCFTHWPGADCFITHHCASRRQKGKIIERYDWWKNDPEKHFKLNSIIYLS